MRLLLDTHALYWYVEGDQKLTGKAQSIIQVFANEVFISPASYLVQRILANSATMRDYSHFGDA